ncbi:MAG: DUF1295 domain-containing protein [Sciscionella sp.]
MDVGAFGENLAISAAVVVAVLVVSFAVTVLRRRFDTIDTAWGLGFAAVGVLGCVLAPGAWRSWLVAILTVLWGVRLARHIHHRNSLRGEDPRYAEIAERAGEHPYRHLLLVVYPVQGAVMWLVSTPLVAAAHVDARFGPLDALGIVVWLIGLCFEVVGDAQLARFKADPANDGTVMDRGLWRFSRHPNYFGDACVWWGLYLIACHHWIAILTIVGPLVMTYLLARGTGKPLTEKHMRETRPGYADYIGRTSGFLPLPPRNRVVR